MVCIEAMKDLSVRGSPCGHVRKRAIEDAIASIQTDGEAALKERYIGVKRYAGFDDQRSDHPSGYGPSHGTIVFSICRNPNSRSELGDIHVFLLEAVRDFGVVEREVNYKKRPQNLCSVLKAMQQAQAVVSACKDALETATITPDGEVSCLPR